MRPMTLQTSGLSRKSFPRQEPLGQTFRQLSRVKQPMKIGPKYISLDGSFRFSSVQAAKNGAPWTVVSPM